MVDADRAALAVMAGIRRHRVEVDQRDAVMLVVVGQEGQHRRLVLHPAVEHRLVPVDHPVELAGAIDHVDEAGRTDAGHGGLAGCMRAAILTQLLMERPPEMGIDLGLAGLDPQRNAGPGQPDRQQHPGKALDDP